MSAILPAANAPAAKPPAATSLAVYTPPSAIAVYIDRHKRHQRKHVAVAVVLCALMTALYLLGNGNIAYPLIPAVAVVVVVLLWHFPDVLLPFSVAASCLIELQQYNFADSITDRLPLFQDVNTAVQIYAHHDFHAVPLSIYEIILIVGTASGLIRALFDHTVAARGGVFLAPILGYLVCVGVGLMNGLATGGDWHIALFEVRAQFYMLFAYLLATSTKRTNAEVVRASLWITAICIGIKGVLLTFRYLVTLGGQTIPEVGVGAHEESFFFNLFVLLYLVLKLGDLEPKLRRIMLIGLPFVVIANLGNERRAATAAMAYCVPILLALCAAAFPQRRKFIGAAAAVLAVLAAVYLPLFWNSDGTIGQPARAIRSQFTPSDRDASSDAYRTAEDANLMFTMRTSPVIGYGYGKPIIIDTPMVDLTSVDPLIHYLVHDQILWVWARVGWVGFVAFWVMISAVLMAAARAASDRLLAPETRAVAIFVVLTFVSLLIFGLLDLQLSNARNVIFSFAWCGILASLLREQEERSVKQIEFARVSGGRVVPGVMLQGGARPSRPVHGHRVPAPAPASPWMRESPETPRAHGRGGGQRAPRDAYDGAALLTGSGAKSAG